jgi:perosamine synthetase
VRIPLSAPDITEAEIEAVTAVLRTPSLSLGPRLPEFEEALAARVGALHAVAVSSGTAGLHLGVRACGVAPGDEVVTTPFSFVASTNAILYERGVPVFVDVERDSLNIDPGRVEAAITPRTRAILPVHVFGRPAAMEAILDIARRRGLAVIEDACEALGAEVGGRAVGTLGRCGVFGFYPNKQITTGEGGMIVTDDGDVAALCRSLRNHGRDDGTGPMVHARLGYNYRLSEIACALGAAQLRRLDLLLEDRASVARRYHDRLAGHADLILPEMNPAGARVSWFVYVVRLGETWTPKNRDRLVAEMESRGIGCRPYFPALHLQPHLLAALGHAPGDFPVAEGAANRTLALPFHGRLLDSEIDEVCGTLLDRLSVAR